MVATIMQNKSTPEQEDLFERIRCDYPELTFVESAHFSWHAGTRHISYRRAPLNDTWGTWALLHELGHALLEHADYQSDVELLKIEVAAWDKARNLSQIYGVPIEEAYIQDSLDSYRDWLHIRATCPTCHERSLQTDNRSYHCHNCNTKWNVTRSRLCRPYRKTYKKSLI